MELIKKLLLKIDPDLRRLFGYLPSYKGKIFASVLFLACAGASSSLIAVLLGKLTDLGFYSKEAWVVAGLPAALVAVAAVNGFCMFMSNYLLAKVSQGILVTVREQLFRKMLYWPANAYQRNNSGFVSSKFINEANGAMGGAASSCVMLVRDTVQIVALLCVLLYYSWQLTIVTLLTAPVIIYIMRWIAKKMRINVGRSQQLTAQILSRVTEAYEAQRLVKVYGSYDREIQRFIDLNNTIRRTQLNITKVASVGTPLTQMVSMIGVAAVVTYALMQAQLGDITIGEFVTFITAMLLILPPLRHLSGLNAAFTSMATAANSVFKMMDEPEEKETGKLVLQHAVGAVEFRHVTLRYPGTTDDAVHDFNLQVRPGEAIAFVGTSGSGKSSIVNLIPRFWEPTAGELLIDGRNYLDYTLASLRSQIALVSQDVFLFEGTIGENIAYGVPGASKEQITSAIEAAALLPFIESLPKGLETPVGEAGNLLSGGQKQRISIARALLKDAPILILDEATSALDSESEHHIKLALAHLMAGRTSFTVAHRLSTIDQADRIVVLEKGVVREIGSHTELLARNGIYANLYRLQTVHPLNKEEEKALDESLSK